MPKAALEPSDFINYADMLVSSHQLQRLVLQARDCRLGKWLHGIGLFQPNL